MKDFKQMVVSLVLLFSPFILFLTDVEPTQIIRAVFVSMLIVIFMDLMLRRMARNKKADMGKTAIAGY